MPAPIATDLKFYPGASGTPVNDTDPIGGAITTGGGVIDDSILNIALDTIFQIGADEVYNALIYVKATHAATGQLNDARIYNRSGAAKNTSSGTCQYVSTSASDTSSILTLGKVSGVFDTDLVVLTGTTPVSGTKVWDVSTVIRHESLNTAGTSAVKPVGNVTVSLSGQILAVLYGTNANVAGIDLAVVWCSNEFQMALGSAINSTRSAANRLTTPASMSAYSNATFWSGGDASIPVPGGVLLNAEYVAIGVQFTAYDGAPIPVSNEIDFFPVLTGTPA